MPNPKGTLLKVVGGVAMKLKEAELGFGGMATPGIAPQAVIVG